MRLKELIKRDVIYKEPNWEKGWEEAQRYEEFKNMSKEDWVDHFKLGAQNKLSSLGQIAHLHTDLSILDPKKIAKQRARIEREEVPAPIIGEWPNGEYGLIDGNHRIATLLDMGLDPTVWVVKVDRLPKAEHPVAAHA